LATVRRTDKDDDPARATRQFARVAANMKSLATGTYSQTNNGSMLSEWRRKRNAGWEQLVASIISDDAVSSVTWEGAPAIGEALQPFVRQHNVAFWSPDGYRNLTGVRMAGERDCIELSASCHAAAILRPRKLTFELMRQAPLESFLLLEFGDLGPLPFYAKASEKKLDDNCEELCEFEPGCYAARAAYHETDPGEAAEESRRVVVRWFSGRVLIVSPGALLNMVPRFDDGSLTALTAAEIRVFIEGALTAIRRMNH
jgi:hypothetical protein